MESKSQYDKFNCKVCLDVAQSPVITPCGHLYCWECIYKWSQQSSSDNTTCPFCNNVFDIDKVSTIYTGDENEGKTPPRPKPKRNPKKEQSNPFSNMHFSFGVGMPFFNFMEFNLNNNRMNGNTTQSISSIIMIVLFIVCNFVMPFYQSSNVYYHSSNTYHQTSNEQNYGLSINSLQLIFVIAIPLIMQIIPRINR